MPSMEATMTLTLRKKTNKKVEISLEKMLAVMKKISL